MDEGEGGRRRRRAVLALVLAAAGLVGDSTYRGGSITGYWPPFLLLVLGLPALVALLAPTRAGRAVNGMAAGVSSLLALVLFPWGIGVWEVPAVATLWMAFAT